MDGFDIANPMSIKSLPDFQTYVYFVSNGKATPDDPYAGMMEALHDNSILQAMFSFLEEMAKPTAAIMGGHKVKRDSEVYSQITRLAKTLTERGFLLASGGGPGAMEATHLGAVLHGQSSKELDDAIAHLRGEPELPDSRKIVDSQGQINDTLVAAIHKWAKPAVELIQKIDSPARSLAVPTWYYGHEPMTPLATHVAKYFQNSIREDVLLALAGNGIVFAPGRAGTVQEIFQDAAQNYYHEANVPFSPMVFFDADGFWTKTLPVEKLLKSLFALNKQEEDFKKKVLFSKDIDQIAEFLTAQNSTKETTLNAFRALGMGKQLMSAKLKSPALSSN